VRPQAQSSKSKQRGKREKYYKCCERKVTSFERTRRTAKHCLNAKRALGESESKAGNEVLAGEAKLIKWELVKRVDHMPWAKKRKGQWGRAEEDGDQETAKT